MINNYQIIDCYEMGIPFVEVYGDAFHYNDLYELVGCKRFMTTFNLKHGSSSYKQYGENVLGVIYYSSKELQSIDTEVTVVSTVKIESPEINLSIENKSNLKYGGIEIADIDYISFLPYQNKMELHDTGEKKVPNIIEIVVDFHGIDPDLLCQGYLISKNNSNVDLLPYEKEKLIGITLGINNGRIDSRLLKHLGFDVEGIKINRNVWFHVYKLKERRGTLSDEERKKYSDIKTIKEMGAIIKVFNEIEKSFARDKEFSKHKDFIKKIIESATSFEPSILLHGKKQIYWDVDSYLHIVMRHIKDYQIGNFKGKTPFSYKAVDLKNLIEKVISCVEDEYQKEFLDKPNSFFVRQGKMAIFFNGDHYNLRIDPNGRLSQFHVVGKGKMDRRAMKNAKL